MTQLFYRVLSYQLAVAQNGYAIAKGVDLVQKVRDKQNRHALIAQLTQNAIKALYFVIVQA